MQNGRSPTHLRPPGAANCRKQAEKEVIGMNAVKCSKFGEVFQVDDTNLNGDEN